jgi:putative ATP-binding cassette transporter
MKEPMNTLSSRKELVLRFWTTASGFWAGPTRLKAWALTVALIAVSLSQIAIQYRLNYWTRDVFNAVGEKDGAALWHQSLVLLPLTALAVALAVGAVFGRMTMQRNWRAWLVNLLIGRWVANGRYYQLNLIKGDHQVPEGRITDDARIATDAPVDFAVGIFQSLVSALTFIGVLWLVGGALTVELAGTEIRIPGYLVLAAVLYSVVITLFMVLIARRFALVSESINQAEAEFRYDLTHIRENGESIALLGGEAEERNGLRQALDSVIEKWRMYCRQHMRATIVSNSNYLIAPAIPIFLCMPKYLSGEMTLGAVTQAAAAFVQVQSAFNWLVDNFPRFADWMASARRVESLLAAVRQLEDLEKPGGTGTIHHSQQEGIALRLVDLTVRLDDGTVVINEADVAIGTKERVLIVGESGTGKSTLVRAIAGLWPWGSGEIATMAGARMFLMPQQPYLPLGSLRRVMTCPLPAADVEDERLHELMRVTGLDHLRSRLDAQEPWEQVLSGGEKQRITFVRLFLQEPDIVIMDEATSALDPASQWQLMNLLAERLPAVAVISISHRPELAEFHDRQLRFEHRPGGSRLVSDVALPPSRRFVSDLGSKLAGLVRKGKP